jgi:hypothetical protein
MKFIAMLLLSVMIAVAFGSKHEPAPTVVIPEGFVSYSFPLKNGLGSIEMIVPKNMSSFRSEIDPSDSPPDDAYVYNFTDTTFGYYKTRGFADDYIGENICLLEIRQPMDLPKSYPLIPELDAYSFSEKIESASHEICPHIFYLEFDTIHIDGHIFRYRESMIYDTPMFPDQLYCEWHGYTIFKNQQIHIHLEVAAPKVDELMQQGETAIRSIRFREER